MIKQKRIPLSVSLCSGDGKRPQPIGVAFVSVIDDKPLVKRLLPIGGGLGILVILKSIQKSIKIDVIFRLDFGPHFGAKRDPK